MLVTFSVQYDFAISLVVDEPFCLGRTWKHLEPQFSDDTGGRILYFCCSEFYEIGLRASHQDIKQ